MGILADEVLVPQVVVRIELNQRNRSVFLCHRAQNWQADGVIAAHANAAHSGLQKWSNSPLDAAEGVLNRKRIHRKITEVGGAVFGERIYVQHGVPRPDNRRLIAYVARAEARPRPISGSPI